MVSGLIPDMRKPSDILPSAGIRWLSSFSIIMSLQILILVVLFANAFFGINVQAVEEGFLEYFKRSIHPERELTYFRIFILITAGIQALGIWMLKKRAEDERFLSGLRGLTLVNAFWLSIQLAALFKMVLFDQPAWTRWLLYAALAGSVVSNVFFSELKRIVIPRLRDILTAHIAAPWSFVLDAAVIIFLFIAIFPDTDKALGQMLAFGQWTEWDHYLMGPLWASAKGLALNVDSFSPLGGWLPVLLGHLARITGGLSYAGVLNAAMLLTILYYAAFYVFLRVWLKNVFLAFVAVILAVKLQLFNLSGVAIIWQHPQLTPLRHLFDIGLLAALWAHQKNGGERWLWTASLLSALAMAYMWDTGLYLTGALLVYLVSDTVGQRFGFFRLRNALMIVAVPFAAAVFILLTAHGNTAQQLFLDGWSKGLGNLPIYDVLKDRQFFPFFMGFVIPLVYTSTLIALMFRWNKPEDEDRWALAVSAYGLLSYQNFVGRSEGASYYLFAAPLVLILCFWAKQALAQSSTLSKNSLGLGASVLIVTALLTGQACAYYPNRFNVAGADWSQQKKLLTEQLNVSADVQLIRRLTGPQDRVALLSSFETSILIGADRKPFFKYFPMVRSQFFRVNSWNGLHLWTRQQLLDTQQQLEEQAPAYIFIEKKMWNMPSMGPAIWQGTPSLMFLLSYLQQKYEPAEQGEYLLVLRKKKL